MMLSELLMIIFLIWIGITFAGMYWAHHTTMFDDEEAEHKPEK